MIIYKTNILKELSDKGYNSKYLRENKVFSQATMSLIRHNKSITLNTVDKICELLECQPGDILEYRKKEPD